uniref:Uncharacterized protein n=1 Tax=Trypanosoma congolense (strain IL3000) TaxID=1068625 RepID=G0UXR2_TRYCI|nr:conserved hypothetical protein [Trypanosoma congolense IL3000]
MMRRVLVAAVSPFFMGIQSRATTYSSSNGERRGGNRGERTEVSSDYYENGSLGEAVPGFDIEVGEEGCERLRASVSNTVRKTQAELAKSKLLFPEAVQGQLRDAEASDGTDPSIDREKFGDDKRRGERVLSKMRKKYDNFDKPKRTSLTHTNTSSNRQAMERDDRTHSDNDEDVTRIYSYSEVGQVDDRWHPKHEEVKSSKVPLPSSVGTGGAAMQETPKARRYKEIKQGSGTRMIPDINTSHGSCSDRKRNGGCDDRTFVEIRASRGNTADKDSATVEEIDDDDHLGEMVCDDDYGELTSDADGAVNKFKNIKKHPFFNDLLHRIEKNAERQRQQIKAVGYYNLDAVNTCIRPLLQLTDYPFTFTELQQMAPFIYPDVLKRSLPDLKACRRLHLYHSTDTNVILDWSVEDFLRRRYESIHLSWEPMKVVMMRFGWNDKIMTDRDCLLFFSKFVDYIELARLEFDPAEKKPRSVAIEDPVRVAECQPVPLSRLLVRRKPSEETEPSVTEAIRLMGVPALWSPSKAKKMRSADKDTVEGIFDIVQREAASVDGDSTARLRHGVDAAPLLPQARSPSGRSIRDFSLGKTRPAAVAESSPQGLNTPRKKTFDDNHASTQESYDSIANEYHKKKVEVSLLRRRLLATNNIDHATELQERLSRTQKELSRLRERLEEKRYSRRVEKGIPERPGPAESNEADTKRKGHWSDESMDIDIEEDAVSKPFTAITGLDREVDEEPVSAFVTQLDSGIMKADQSMEKNCNAAGDSSEKIKLSVLSGEGTPNAKCLGNSVTSDDCGELQSLSSAAIQLRQEIELTREKHRREEEGLMKKMDEALATLLKIERAMKNLADRGTEEARLEEEKRRVEKERREEEIKRVKREEAEARAHAMEQELLRKHEERMKLLNIRREKAQKAQRDAELELERHKKEEQEALDAEAELQRKLNEAKSMIWSDNVEIETLNERVSESIEGEYVGTASHGDDDGCNHAELNEKEQSSPSMSTLPEPSATLPSASGPSCTPEQYDGLHLASRRLRREIAELERQMDAEGDEDDMTLMAVLAVSRAELEELEGFIKSVQMKEPWAAKRDKARREEELNEARMKAEHPCDVQERISDIRFQISLMEKRLEHATERKVITKLEQGIINGRREINRLRVEQDRLRRSGRPADAGGIRVPLNISVAETLAEVEKEGVNELAGEGGDDPHGEGSPEALNGPCEEEAIVDRGEPEYSGVGGATDSLLAEEHDGVGSSRGGVIDNTDTTLQDDENELRQLMARLETMLADIKRLEERLDEQEDGDDAEAIARSLTELQNKLQQLLEMRETIKRRTEQALLKKRAGSGEVSLNVPGKTSAAPSIDSNTPVIVKSLLNRPVSGYGQHSGEVIRFGRNDSNGSGTVGGKKSRKVTKSKKVRG